MHLVVQGFVARVAWKGEGSEWSVSDFSLPNRLEWALVQKLFGCPVPRCSAWWCRWALLTREQIERPEPFDMLLLLNWTILLFLFWQWTSWAIWWFSSWGWDTSRRAWGCPVCWRCGEMNELCAYRNLLELLKLSTSDSLTPLSSKVSDGFAVIVDTVVCCPEPAKELQCSSLN